MNKECIVDAIIDFFIKEIFCFESIIQRLKNFLLLSIQNAINGK